MSKRLILLHCVDAMKNGILLNKDYIYRESLNVWLNRNPLEFHYSDGDRTETSIGEILKSVKDKSVFSDELKSHIVDWPTVYYFSAARSNILRPFEKTLLSGAGLLSDMANSLCYVAAANALPENIFEEDRLVIHYGGFTALPKKYAKEVAITQKNGNFSVTRRKLDAEEGATTDDYYQILENEPYINGELLYSKIRKITMRPDWSLEEFFAAFQPWVNGLLENADSDWNCDGRMLDYTPFNLFIKEGAVIPFDLEWAAKKRLSLSYLLYRGFYNTLMRLLPLRKSPKHNLTSFSQFFSEFMKTLNLPLTLPSTLDYLWWQEVKFMKSIKNKKKYNTPKDFKIVYMP